MSKNFDKIDKQRPHFFTVVWSGLKRCADGEEGCWSRQRIHEVPWVWRNYPTHHPKLCPSKERQWSQLPWDCYWGEITTFLQEIQNCQQQNPQVWYYNNLHVLWYHFQNESTKPKASHSEQVNYKILYPKCGTTSWRTTTSGRSSQNSERKGGEKVQGHWTQRY